VLGVIANLAAWFGFHALFARAGAHALPWGHVITLPQWASFDPVAAAIALAAGLALIRFRANVLVVIAACAAAGVVRAAF
jgi:chromate transporter